MAEIDKLNFVMGMNTSGMAKSGGVVTRIFGKMNTKFLAVLGTVGVMSAAFIAFASKAVKAASEFEVAWNEVRTLLDETKVDSEALREEVLDLAAAVGRPPEEVSRGLYQVISAGVQDTADAMEVLEVATKASIAGLTDQFTAVDAITTVLNAYNLEISDATRVSDLMFNAVKEGKLTFTDLASNIGNVASTASLAKVSFEEVTAALATMTKAGLSMEESTTALNQLLLQTIKAQDEAKVTAKEFGFELSATALEAKGLVGLMNDIADATEGDIEALVKLMPNIRAFRGEAILAGTGLDEFNRILETTTDVIGSAEEAFNKMKESTTELAREMNTKINVVFIRLGEKLLPLVNAGLEEVIKFLDEIGESRVDKLIKNLQDLEGGEGLARQILLREKQRELIIELGEMQKEMIRIEKENSLVLATSAGITERWGKLSSDVLQQFRGISTSIVKIARQENGLIKLEELRGDAQKLLDEARINAGKEMLENNNKLSESTEDGLKLTEGTVLLIDEMIGKMKLQELTQEDIIQLELAISKLRKEGIKDTEEITKNIKEAASEDLKLDLTVAFTNIGQASDAIGRLGNEIGALSVSSSNALIQVGNVAEGFARLGEVAETADATFADKLIPELLIATSAYKILNKTIFDTNKNTMDWVATLEDFNRRIGISDLRRSLADLEGVALSEDRALNLTFAIRSLIADLESGETTNVPPFLREFLDILQRTDFSNEASVKALNDFITLNAENLSVLIGDLQIDNLESAEEFRALLGTFETGLDGLLAELIAIRIAAELSLQNEEELKRMRAKARAEEIAGFGKRDLLNQLIASGFPAQVIGEIFGGTRAQALALLEQMFADPFARPFEDQIALLLALLEVMFGVKDELEEIRKTTGFGRRAVGTRGFLGELGGRIADEGGIADPFIQPENRSVRQFVGITELQGNLVIGILNTSRAIQQEILNLLDDRLIAGGGVGIETINENLGNDIENSERGIGVLS